MPESGPLPPGTAALVALSAALATRNENGLKKAMQAAASVADPAGVEEVLLQSHLFLGFPLALEAMRLWREVGRQAASTGEAGATDEWAQRGVEVCARVYGDHYEKLRRNVMALHPAADRWMVDHGYGRVLGRTELELRTRELCIVALLAVWNAPRQLHSHLRGALNAGATVAEVSHALAIAIALLDPEQAARVQGLWESVAGGRAPAGVDSPPASPRAVGRNQDRQPTAED